MSGRKKKRHTSLFLNAPKNVVRTILISSIVLLVAALALVICGLLSRPSLSFYVAASVLISTAALLTLCYIWLQRRKPTKAPLQKISIISDYYSQVPPGRESDFPMGPNLVMTLPTPPPRRPYGGNRRAKNLPPLASVETLTLSSWSISSVV